MYNLAELGCECLARTPAVDADLARHAFPARRSDLARHAFSQLGDEE
jgi:hypothetical protein